jgi:hypothetical protein
VHCRAGDSRHRGCGSTTIEAIACAAACAAAPAAAASHRAVKLLPDSPFNWIQLTYCIISKQRFAAYKTDPKTGRETLVEGDPSKGEEVVEYCVFERKTRQGWSKTPGKAMPTLKMQEALEGSRWRLVAWLDP